MHCRIESLEKRLLLSGAPTAARPASNDGTGFFVSGGEVYDANGVRFEMRGFNHTTWWGNQTNNLAAIAQFPKTKANAVRAVMGTGDGWSGSHTPAQRRNIVETYIANKIVPIVEDHMGTCENTSADLSEVVDRWLVPDNVSWLRQYEREIILNIANEWGPDSTVYLNAYKTAITRLRDADINAMIMIDAGGCGQNIHTLQAWAQQLLDHDPQHNIVFSIHMYGNWRTEDGAAEVGTWDPVIGSPWDVATELQEVKDAGLPIVVGEFSWDGTDFVGYDTERAVEIFDDLDLGWLAWSWNQNSDPVLDMVAGGDKYQYNTDADLTDFGRFIINDPAVGLKATAVPATIWAPYVPEADLYYANVAVAAGDTTPSAGEGTDFGSVAAGGSAISRTFTVKNTGVAPLTTSGLKVPAGYRIAEPLSSTLAAGGSDTFTLQLTTASAGTFAGTVSFANNDASENPYTVSITGKVEAPPTVGVDVILDNTTAAATGVWSASTYNKGFYGANYVHDGNNNKGSKSVTWTPNLPAAGTYEVYAWWTQATNRATNVPYEIVHKNGTATVTKDQRTGGGSWQLLGTFSFNAGTGGRVKVSNAGTSGYVVADAVRFFSTGSVNVTPPAAASNASAMALSSSSVRVTWNDNSANESGFKVQRKKSTESTWATVQTTAAGVKSWDDTGLAASTSYDYRIIALNVAGDAGPSNTAAVTTPAIPPPAQELILDNAAGVVAGTWSPSTYNTGYYGANYIHDGNNTQGSKSVTWTPNLPSGGSYEVYAWWPAAANRATNVPYEITHATGTAKVIRNQRIGGSSWQLLGTYDFNAGTAGKVRVSNTGTNGYVVADAVKFVRLTTAALSMSTVGSTLSPVPQPSPFATGQSLWDRLSSADRQSLLA